jgi:hypothetical protein
MDHREQHKGNESERGGKQKSNQRADNLPIHECGNSEKLLTNTTNNVMPPVTTTALALLSLPTPPPPLAQSAYALVLYRSMRRLGTPTVFLKFRRYVRLRHKLQRLLATRF